MYKVEVREERVLIPTYEISEYDKNPVFLEKRVYQGSSGRVYPHPVCYGVADSASSHEYSAIFLENDYISVMILPELGGRIQRIYDKTNGYDAVYYNEVVKPALVGLAGPWISGGIEFNWPQHHRPSTFDPVDCTVRENDDGSATVYVGETEKMFHTKCTTGFTLYPDRAYLEVSVRIYNPTERPQTFLWWANPAVAVNEDTRSIFPPDVNAVMDHGKRDVSKFPIADGIYYKVDYAPGTDISRYKNIPVPTSYMAYHSDFDFIGNYDYGRHAGLLHIADHHVSPGKKQWTWGNGDFGQAWDRNLTDRNGPYIELMTGVFTDNQPDFTFLKPYEEKTFFQYFMPYKEVGEVKNASLDAILNVEADGGCATVAVYTPSGIKDASLSVFVSGKRVYSCPLSLGTANVFRTTVPVTAPYESLSVKITDSASGKVLLSHVPVRNTSDIPEPASAIPSPEEIPTNEKLFLAATHLEQYRHATYSPEPYYLEGLRRDPDDIRINNGYGKFLFSKGMYDESVKYFRSAVAASVWKNPNPYDCEPYYNLGLALSAIGDMNGAYDAFYKATWDGAMQAGAFYRLALIASQRGEYGAALGFAELSLVRGAHNMRARTLKTALLRLLGKTDEAAAFAAETTAIDALDHGSRYELFLISGSEEPLSSFRSLLRGDEHSYIELAITYLDAGLTAEADRLLALIPESGPMAHYYRYFAANNASELDAAEAASPLYCFPNRLFDIAVLERAIAGGAVMAKYYLGLLLYDKGRHTDATSLWESCADSISLPTVHRNLALSYYNKLHEPQKALASMERAFVLDETDARVFFELDCLRRELAFPPQERLRLMEKHTELLPKRDDLYTEYITLLNVCGRPRHAYDLMMSHIFHPWEGGEGKITAQYRSSLIKLAAEDNERAEEYLRRALSYPHNLGEGKLIGCLDNDIYYLLGRASRDPDEAGQFYRLAARGDGYLGTATYYNDQPPEMMYYAALAYRMLGDEAEARRRFRSFIQYAVEHEGEKPKIDYFAVSLPDFLIFDADLEKKNRVHCLFLSALGRLGLGETDTARESAKAGLALDPSHAGLNDILKETEAKR